jgi:acyl carrier protein
MVTTFPRILDEVLELMTSLAGDWEFGGDISSDTFLLADLGFESLDLVVLGTTLQERYGRLPFSELLADIGQRLLKDLTVEELVAFVCQYSN